MRTPEIQVSKEGIVSTNRLNYSEVLYKLRNGGWVDANAALQALDERDAAWKPEKGHRSESEIPFFTPLPLAENKLRPEGTRRGRPPKYGNISLD